MFLPPDDEGYLILHNQDPEEWAKRYGLVLDDPDGSMKCYACQAPRRPTLPFVLGKIRGMVSEHCACGHRSRAPYVMMMPNADLLELGDLKSFEAETAKAWEVWSRKEKERKRIARNARRRHKRRIQKEA